MGRPAHSNRYLADGNADNDLKIIILPSGLFCCIVTAEQNRMTFWHQTAKHAQAFPIGEDDIGKPRKIISYLTRFFWK